MASSSPYQTPSPRTSMSIEERQAQIAYPDDAPLLYAEPQPLYCSPAYTPSDWSPPADYYAKIPALADSRPRGLAPDWADSASFALPPYPQAPPAYVAQQLYPRSSYDMRPLPPADDGFDVKAEPAMVVPTQGYYARTPSVASSMGPPHAILHVVFTDDAASKETQYLRRRCHNCHQVEPPSWRRSHLVPGKIVCNRCGLYERTHLRPRPHRFDEVRTGNKGRKPAKQPAARPDSPPAVSQFTVKQELVPDVEFDSRRGSVASFSSASSHSEWEDGYSAALAGTPLRLSPTQQPATHEGGVQRAHLGDALSARLRAGRKSATSPYEAYSAARISPPTPPHMPGAEPAGLFDVSGAFAASAVRRHTHASDDISAWSALPTDFTCGALQPPQPVVSSIAY